MRMHETPEMREAIEFLEKRLGNAIGFSRGVMVLIEGPYGSEETTFQGVIVDEHGDVFVVVRRPKAVWSQTFHYSRLMKVL